MLNDKFQGLKDVQIRFNERIFQIISNTYQLVKTERGSRLLICALRVVMNEEINYRDIVEKKYKMPDGDDFFFYEQNDDE